MSIILEGIDLPKGKDEALLLLILGDGTVAEKINSNRYEEMADTEAIQIPKGARLIDGNDLLWRIVRTPSYKVNINGAPHTVFRDIDVLPEIRHSKAILESEEFCKL